MPRPKGSKNKPKTDVTITVIPTVKRGRGRPRKINELIAASKTKVPAKKQETKVLPNVDFEGDGADDGMKIVQCPYMGPDADDSEMFIREQIIGSKQKWNDEDFGGSFSINVDSLY